MKPTQSKFYHDSCRDHRSEYYNHLIQIVERCRNDEFRRMLLRYAPELRNLIKQQELDLPEIPLFIQKKKMRSKLTRFSQLKFSFADNDKDFMKIRDICLLGGRLNQPAPKIFSL